MYGGSQHFMKSEDATISNTLVNEYERQKEHLQACVESLKEKLSEQSSKHRSDNLQVMLQNIKHMDEIQELRKQLKMLTQVQGRISPTTATVGKN